jgi:uncharacterized protein YcaQ
VSEITLSPTAARRFLIRAFVLDGFQTLPTVADAVERLEFVQEDSINICGRIHDLILRPRVAGYTPQALHEYLYGPERQGFEYYFPNLSVLPLTDYRHFMRVMHARRINPGRWNGLLPEEEPVAAQALGWMDENGPLRSRSVGSEHGHATSGWGMRQTVINQVVEKLWLQGHLTVAKRENFERWFDRTERLLPDITTLTPAEEKEERAYLALKRLRARRLFRLKKTDSDLLGKESFTKVQIDGDRRAWHVLAEDTSALETAEATPVSDTAHLLAPLDPLVYDRERNRVLFNFDYIWEVYTPAAKRRWGYYALPILHGDRLVGRLDPKIDRINKILFINALHWEEGTDIANVTPRVAECLQQYARWLGAESIRFSENATNLSGSLRKEFEVDSLSV